MAPGMRAPNMRMKSPIAVVALVAALGSALGACSSGSGGPATEGPLSSGTSAHGRIPRGGNCVTFPPSSRVQAFADQQFTNHGHATVVLDRVVLLHPHNERLIGSAVIPGTRVIGVIPWPPNYPSVRGRWKTRQPVHGYRVAPGKTFNMVLGATPPAQAMRSRRACWSTTTTPPAATWPRVTSRCRSHLAGTGVTSD